MEESIKFLSKKDFHQTLWLQANADHEGRRVTYATTTNFDHDDLPVILFCGPLFGSRWNAVMFDHLAKTTGVRVVCVDRPGMGGSTPVPINVRVDAWLETVPSLLKALNVKHVSLVSHSAGTIYLMNTVYQQRDILDPHTPYIGLITPWVDTEHSRTTLMQIISTLPASWLDSWDTVNGFIIDKIAPSLSWSGGVLTSMINILTSDPGVGDASQTTSGERYGVSEEVGKSIDELQVKWWLAENRQAANDEARLCLRKDGGGSWGVCSDYQTFVQRFVERERERRAQSPERSKVEIQIFFAETDIMIGKGGQRYFEGCWQQEGTQDAFDIKMSKLPGTDHDSALLDVKGGALKQIFERVANARNPS